MEATEVLFATASTPRDAMFNRAVELLQPPYNYMPMFRSPGRINLNTTPDYIRRGGSYHGNYAANVVDQMLDVGEQVLTNVAPTLDTDVNDVHDHVEISRAAKQISQSLLPAGLGSVTGLFGDGLVYRSFAWGGSDAHDLDDVRRRLSLTGTVNFYEMQVDSDLVEDLRLSSSRVGAMPALGC